MTEPTAALVVRVARDRHGCRMLAVLALVAATVLPAHAQSRLDEDGVKAAFLYNFLKFVQWPAGSQAGPLVIGVVGDDLFFEDLLHHIVKGKTVQEREVVVRQFRHDDDLALCHILFIGESEARRTPELLQRLQTAPILTVGETVHFLHEGGIARFFVEERRVRFQINPSSAERAGLQISSQLLSLGTK